jgi:hypothetical protein
VVVTTGALQVLPAERVAAVLDHERAHAAGHHQLLTDVARLLAADGACLALGEGVRLRRLGPRRDDVDACGGEDGVEGGGELGVAVAP